MRIEATEPEMQVSAPASHVFQCYEQLSRAVFAERRVDADPPHPDVAGPPDVPALPRELGAHDLPRAHRAAAPV